MSDGDDVLDQPRAGNCPRCGSHLQHPELDYDDTGVATYDGPGSMWCPVCGWDSHDDVEAEDEP